MVKQAGFDGVLNEILKVSHISYFPAAWAKEIICSIFEGVIKNNPGNYPGISLLSCISKIFTGIIYKRLVNWTEKENFLDILKRVFEREKVLLTTYLCCMPLRKDIYRGREGNSTAVLLIFQKPLILSIGST